MRLKEQANTLIPEFKKKNSQSRNVVSNKQVSDIARIKSNILRFQFPDVNHSSRTNHQCDHE
jgi:hypothetical protein